MFGLVILVFFILNQVDFRKAMDCSSVAYSEEPCNITREVSLNQGTLVWRKDTAFILLTNHPCTSQTNGNFSGYCFDNSLNRFYILEILHPEYHDQSIFTDSVTTDKTTFDLMVPDNLSSTDLTLLIPDKIDGDKIIMSASIDCCKPMPTCNWSLVVLDSNTRYVFENSTMTSDNSCSPRLLKWNSSLTVDLNALDPTIIEQGKDISIKIDVNFGCCKTVSSVPVTVTNIEVDLKSTSSTPNPPSTTITNVSEPGSTVEPPICCCYSLVLLIITAVLVVVFMILVIVHFCRRDAKKEGNMYWVINVVLILIGIMCLILSIIQILYLGCVIACTDLSLCSDKTGHDASIAFIVLGFIVVVLCIVLFVIRYKQRDQSKETNNTNHGKETNGTERTSHGTNHTNPGKETIRTERTSHGTNNTNLEKETNGTERTSHGTNHTNPGKETNRTERTSHGTNHTNPGKETNRTERTSQETNNTNLEKETNGTEKTKNRTSIRLLPIPNNS